jgi:RNA polymerase sigma factor (TIGR02999 family)
LKLSLSEADRLIKDEDVNLIALDESLERLSKDYPQASGVVELRFFGGLSIAETAKILNVSDSTVERDWRFARAWLRRELDKG